MSYRQILRMVHTVPRRKLDCHPEWRTSAGNDREEKVYVTSCTDRTNHDGAIEPERKVEDEDLGWLICSPSRWCQDRHGEVGPCINSS